MSFLSRVASRPRELSAVWSHGLDEHVIDLAFSRDGQSIAAAEVGGPVHILDAASGRRLRSLNGHRFGTASIDWRPDNRQLASVGQDGVGRIWDATTGAVVAELDVGSQWAERVRCSRRGNLLATAAGKRLKLWDANGRLVKDFGPQTSTVYDLAWRPQPPRGDDRPETLAVTSYGVVRLFDVENQSHREEFAWKGSSLTLAWSPDGSYIATGDQDSSVHFWITKTGRDLRMWGYETKVRELSWDHTSRWLATGGGTVVCAWDCSGRGPEGRTPRMFHLHERYVSAVAFQHRGRLLASGGEDGRIGVFDLGSSSESALAAMALNASITRVAWSPDDKVLAIGDEAGGVRLLRVTVG